jgi:DNA-binding transcriptional ArsR family regulator
MDARRAIIAFSALAQSTRLDVFRLLAKHEPDGLPAGEIARRIRVPHNTMSTHLAILNRAGLIIAERQSRFVLYRAQLDTVRGLKDFIVRDCRGG